MSSTTSSLIRPASGRLLAGVCAALAARIGWRVSVVRVLWVLLGLLPGPLWIAYVVLWAVIPAEPRR